MYPPERTGKLYDVIAEEFHAAMKNSEYGLPLIQRAISYCENKKLALDIGCGAGGRILNSLINNGFEVCALDISVKMLAFARSKHPGINFYQADITTWQTSFQFDLIVGWDSLFHLPIQQQPVLEKIISWLSPNGILIYTLGDGYGEHEGHWQGVKFGYSTIGVEKNLAILTSHNCRCLHLEWDQFPENHVCIIAQ